MAVLRFVEIHGSPSNDGGQERLQVGGSRRRDPVPRIQVGVVNTFLAVRTISQDVVGYGQQKALILPLGLPYCLLIAPPIQLYDLFICKNTSAFGGMLHTAPPFYKFERPFIHTVDKNTKNCKDPNDYSIPGEEKARAEQTLSPGMARIPFRGRCISRDFPFVFRSTRYIR